MQSSKPGRKSLSRDKLTELFEKMPTSALLIEQEQIVINDAAERLSGYRKDEIASVDDWFKKLHPTEHEKYRRLYEADSEAGFPVAREVTITRKDGSIRFVEFTCAGSGLVVCILHDVTDRYLTEERLRGSEQRFRAIADYTCDWENWFGPDGKLVWVNPAVEKITGFTIDECMSIPDFPLPLVHHEDREDIEKRFISAINGSSGEDVEFRLLCKDGRTKWLTVSWQPIYNSDGMSLGHRSSIHDITDRKHSEEALQITQEWLIMAQRAAHAGSWCWELSSGKLTWSEEFYTLFELAPTCEATFDTWLAKLHPDDRSTAMEKIEQAMKVGSFLENEYRIVNSDGTERWICALGKTFYDGAGHPLSMCGLCIDITERKWLECELLQSRDELERRVTERTRELTNTIAALEQEIATRKKLENQLLQSQKMESIGILAGGVAHEFNNLLTAISGCCEELQEETDENDELSHSNIAMIQSATKEAAELTRNLLAFGRQQFINPKPVAVNDVIADTRKLLVRMLEENIHLSVELSNGQLVVMADSGQLKQVIVNLAINARDAMPSGGHLKIGTRQVMLDEAAARESDLEKPGNYAVISVSDTGMGMDERIMDKIFEPFFTTKEVGKGTGLGLSIIYGIIKQHNGSITVASKPGDGTTFTIFLPRIESEIKQKEPQEKVPASGGAETVLLVEDEELVRHFMEKALDRAGYRVITARDGEEAVAKFKQHLQRISLIISDMVMPNKSGLEMYHEISRIRPRMKVLFVSGYSSYLIENEGISPDYSDFITKPLSKNDLLRKTRELLDKNLVDEQRPAQDQ